LLDVFRKMEKREYQFREYILESYLPNK